MFLLLLVLYPKYKNFLQPSLPHPFSRVRDRRASLKIYVFPQHCWSSAPSHRTNKQHDDVGGLCILLWSRRSPQLIHRSRSACVHLCYHCAHRERRKREALMNIFISTILRACWGDRAHKSIASARTHVRTITIVALFSEFPNENEFASSFPPSSTRFFLLRIFIIIHQETGQELSIFLLPLVVFHQVFLSMSRIRFGCCQCSPKWWDLFVGTRRERRRKRLFIAS